VTAKKKADRSGVGGSWFLGQWVFPVSIGGCPNCGAIGTGGHGGGCNLWSKKFDKEGKELWT
jgi:hypothetical protein